MSSRLVFPRHRLAAALLTGLAFATIAAAADPLGGNYAIGPSDGPLSVSSDGRFVLFASGAINLDPAGNHNAQDLFLLDSADGRFQRIETHDADSPTNGYPDDAAVSDDGRYVLYTRWERPAGNPQPIIQVYRLDRATATATLVSAFGGGSPGAGNSFAQALSADGRYAVFATDAVNLGGGTGWIMLRHDFVTGTRETVSVLGQNQVVPADPGYSDMTPDGRYVTFHGQGNLYVRDMVAGVTTLASVGVNGAAAGAEAWPMPMTAWRGCNNRIITPDGRYVVFTTFTDIDPADTSLDIDVYRYDRVTNTSRWVSNAAGPSVYAHWSRCASISADGRKVSYLASAQGQAEHLFVRDMDAAVPRRIATRDYAEDFGNPTLSSDGTLFFTLNYVPIWGYWRQLVRQAPEGRFVLLTQPTAIATDRK